MTVKDLPTLNACLNALSAVLLLLGYIQIKRGNREAHKKLMFIALLSSAVFLTCYLIYHAQVGSVPYPRHDWTRPLYFFILIPHVILAALMVPFIIRLVWLAAKGEFIRHAKLARLVWPVWMYVSVTGVVVYGMLYLMPNANPFSKEVVAQAKFPLYYAEKLPDDFSLCSEPVKASQDIINFCYHYDNGKTLVVTEQARPQQDMEQVKKIKAFTTDVGRAFIATLNGSTTGMLFTDKTLVILNAALRVDPVALEDLIKNLQQAH
jgi:putative membrane protein